MIKKLIEKNWTITWKISKINTQKKPLLAELDSMGFIKKMHLKNPTILSTFEFFQFSKIFVCKKYKNKINAYGIKIYFLVLQTRNFIRKKAYKYDNKVYNMIDKLWIRNRKLSIVHKYLG